MNILFNLKNHCLETEAKRQYEQSIGSFFSKHHSPIERNALEMKIQALLFFVGHADFPRLRSKYSELAGNNEISVELNFTGKFDAMQLRIHGGDNITDWKKRPRSLYRPD
jgi:hypothetical protein